MVWAGVSGRNPDLSSKLASRCGDSFCFCLKISHERLGKEHLRDPCAGWSGVKSFLTDILRAGEYFLEVQTSTMFGLCLQQSLKEGSRARLPKSKSRQDGLLQAAGSPHDSGVPPKSLFLSINSHDSSLAI